MEANEIRDARSRSRVEFPRVVRAKFRLRLSIDRRITADGTRRKKKKKKEKNASAKMLGNERFYEESCKRGVAKPLSTEGAASNPRRLSVISFADYCSINSDKFRDRFSGSRIGAGRAILLPLAGPRLADLFNLKISTHREYSVCHGNASAAEMQFYSSVGNG